MATNIEFFPHGGEHLGNDLHQAHVTIWLLAAFAVVAAIFLIAGLRAL